MKMTRAFYQNSRYSYDLVYSKPEAKIEVYYFTDNRGKPCMLMFQGRAQKPYVHYSYASEDARDTSKEFYLNALVERKKQQDARAKEKREFVHSLVVGDILHSSWGYEQTNNDFYQVIARNGKSVTIREIASSYEQTGWLCGNRKPIADKFIGEAMRKRVSMGNYVTISRCQSASKCDPNR